MAVICHCDRANMSLHVEQAYNKILSDPLSGKTDLCATPACVQYYRFHV